MFMVGLIWYVCKRKTKLEGGHELTRDQVINKYYILHKLNNASNDLNDIITNFEEYGKQIETYDVEIANEYTELVKEFKQKHKNIDKYQKDKTKEIINNYNKGKPISEQIKLDVLTDKEKEQFKRFDNKTKLTDEEKNELKNCKNVLFEPLRKRFDVPTEPTKTESSKIEPLTLITPLNTIKTEPTKTESTKIESTKTEPLTLITPLNTNKAEFPKYVDISIFDFYNGCKKYVYLPYNNPKEPHRFLFEYEPLSYTGKLTLSEGNVGESSKEVNIQFKPYNNYEIERVDENNYYINVCCPLNKIDGYTLRVEKLDYKVVDFTPRNYTCTNTKNCKFYISDIKCEKNGTTFTYCLKFIGDNDEIKIKDEDYEILSKKVSDDMNDSEREELLKQREEKQTELDKQLEKQLKKQLEYVEKDITASYAEINKTIMESK